MASLSGITRPQSGLPKMDKVNTWRTKEKVNATFRSAHDGEGHHLEEEVNASQLPHLWHEFGLKLMDIEYF